jgi:NitT/TauT family transport system substrate-binding protein
MKDTRRRYRSIRCLAAVAVLALAATACGGEGDDPAAGETADEAGTQEPGAEEPGGAGEATGDASAVVCEDIGTVRFGLTSSVSDAPLFIADERGYFDEVGIDAEMVDFASAAQMIAPLGGGQLDVGAGAPSAGFYNALSRELNFRIVADKGSMPENYGYMPLLVRADLYESGEVTGPEDFAGLRVAEPAQGTATASTLNTILESSGLDYGDVQHEFLGFAEHVTAYENEAIDASLTTEPSATIIEEQGLAVRLGTPPDWYDNQQLAVILYSEDFIARDDRAGTCTMIAYLRGVRDYVDALDDGQIDGDSEVAQIIQDRTGLSAERLVQITPNWVDPDGRLNQDSLETDYAFFEGEGLLEGEVDLGQIVDPSFAEAAVAELGEYEG